MKKTVLITEASSGIGRATARLFAEQGWNVVATMRRPGAETDLAGTGDLMVSRLDVQDGKSVREAVEGGIARFGRIDALINKAGCGQYGLFEYVAFMRSHFAPKP